MLIIVLVLAVLFMTHWLYSARRIRYLRAAVRTLSQNLSVYDEIVHPRQ
jgi:hypothetical protein